MSLNLEVTFKLYVQTYLPHRIP